MRSRLPLILRMSRSYAGRFPSEPTTASRTLRVLPLDRVRTHLLPPFYPVGSAIERPPAGVCGNIWVMSVLANPQNDTEQKVIRQICQPWLLPGRLY